MRESIIEQKLIKGVRALGGLCLKWESPSFTGVPDRIVLLPGGRIFFAELKQRSGALSPRQKYVRKQLSQLGFKVHTVKGEEGVADFLKLINGQKRI